MTGTNDLVCRLERYRDNGLCTFGRLSIDNKFKFYVIEDPVREIIGVKVDIWKIPKVTAIPSTDWTGRPYRLKIDYSPRFRRNMVTVLDVPGFAGIRVHAGIDQNHTEGCLIIGQKVNKLGIVPGTSAQAVQEFFDIVMQAENDGKKPVLYIENKIMTA